MPKRFHPSLPFPKGDGFAPIFRRGLLHGLVALVLASPWLAAQDEAPVAPRSGLSQKSDVSPPTSQELESRLAAITADPNIPAALKPSLEKQYKEAIGLLASAASFQEQEQLFRDALESAPRETRESRVALAEPEAARPAVPDSKAATEDALSTALSDYAAASGKLDDVTKQLAAAQDMQRNGGSRKLKARDDLQATTREIPPLAADQSPSPGVAASLAVLQSRRAALTAEISMIEMEQLSHPARVEALDARQELLTRRTAALKRWIENLQDQKDRLISSSASNEVNEARELARKATSGTPAEKEASARILELALEYEKLAADAQTTTGRLRAAKRQLEQVRSTSEGIRERYEIGGLSGNFSELLQRRRITMEAPGAYRTMMTDLSNSLSDARLGEFMIREELEKITLDLESSPGDTGENISRLIRTRQDLLAKMQDAYQEIIHDLTNLIALEQDIQESDEKIHLFLQEKLFWVRSIPPLGLESTRDLPAALRDFWSNAHRNELGKNLGRIPFDNPFLTVVVIIAFLVRLAFGKRLHAALRDSGKLTRRISTDSYHLTVRALLITLLFALPVPVALSVIAASVGDSADTSGWMHGMALGLGVSAFQAYAIFFLITACKSGGLGEMHFGWDENVLRSIRRSARLVFAVILPTNILVGSTFYGSPGHFESLGRISFMLGEILLACVLVRALRPADGVFSRLLHDHPGGFTARSWKFWVWILIGTPLFLAAMAAAGYLVTALTLSQTIRTTLWIVAGGFVAHALILRWFLIRERKLALHDAIERRRERQKEAASEVDPVTNSDEIEIEDLEAGLDIQAIGQQTRRLVKVVVLIGLFIAQYYIWTTQLQSFRVLDSIQLTTNLTLSGLLRAALAGFVTFVAARNLPGMLEVAVLGLLKIDYGTRKAISSLCQYAVIICGGALTLHFLKVDWSQFAWFAAALSVGIGFGLQEIVANFICGIIILFERPIRVGDTVTVQDIEGVVTRIQMRATTITNWDRKDFIVPNKEIVTGTLMNWTLTSPITRTTIPVGVAYGSDTNKARAILQEIAENHPDVLTDPAPFTTFLDFGDSALMLDLRIYISDVTRRISITSSIRQAISDRFATEGIEISFPQRDLNIRSISPEASKVLGLKQSENHS